MSRFWLSTGAILAGLSVAAGALAAHFLESYFQEKYPISELKLIAGESVRASFKYLQDFKTGAEYQMYHALGLIAVGVVSQTRKSSSLQVAGWSFLVGIFFFSGCLYALAITGQTKLGALVPIGGVAFLVGWGSLAVGVMSPESGKTEI